MSLGEQTASRQQDEKRWRSLMKRSQDGYAAAYHQLLSELAPVIESYVRVNFGSLTMLEDCVQESLFAIHRARHTFDYKRDFRPWMFTIVRYKTIDILRRNDTVNNTVAKWVELDQSNCDPVDLDRLIDGGRLMAKLSDEQREAVTLTKYLGMTANEAAHLVGIKEHTIKARLRRGLTKLHKQWQQDGSEHGD